jgi:hypothetical protein
VRDENGDKARWSQPYDRRVCHALMHCHPRQCRADRAIIITVGKQGLGAKRALGGRHRVPTAVHDALVRELRRPRGP